MAATLGAVADAAGLERFAVFAASKGVPVAIADAARAAADQLGLDGADATHHRLAR